MVVSTCENFLGQKAGEVQMESVVHSIALGQCQFPYLEKLLLEVLAVVTVKKM